jgi:hypothetical protein
MTMKAKSRLKPSFFEAAHEPHTSPILNPPSQSRFHHSLGGADAFWRRYLSRWPALVLAIASYVALTYLLTTVPPSQISHLLFPNSYLPFHLLLLMANYGGLSFLLLNNRRGLLTALAFQTWLFLKLQSVLISWQVVAVILVFFGTIEISANLITLTLKLRRKAAPRAAAHVARRPTHPSGS